MSESSASYQLARSKTILPALLCAFVGALLFQFFGNATQGYIHSRSLFYWWSIQWFDPTAETQHGALIVLVALWLFWRNLGQSRKEATFHSWNRAAAAAMLGGLALHLGGFALQQTRLSVVAALVFFWGVLALAGGKRVAHAATFPIGFMLLAIPVSFIDTLGFNLRLAVAENATSIAQKFGIALVRYGTQLSSGDGHIQYDVAAACSGIRSLVALFALALLIGYLWLGSWFARLALTAACLPFVVVGNIVRVLLIVLVAHYVGQSGANSSHEVSGYVSFAVVFALLLAFLALLRRVGFGARKDEVAKRGSTQLPPPATWRTAGAVCAVTVCVASCTALLGRMQQQHFAGIRLDPDAAAPVDLPAFLGTEWIGRRVDVSQVEREVLPPDTGYSRKNYVHISDPNQQVFVSVVLSGRDRTSIHRPELCLVGQGWSISAQSNYDFETAIGPIPARLLTIDHAAHVASGADAAVHSLLAYWFVGSNTLERTHLAMQYRDLADRIHHFRSDRWAYITVQTFVSNDGEAAALSRMQEVVAQVWPQLSVPPTPQ